jgi:hypothetical protein
MMNNPAAPTRRSVEYIGGYVGPTIKRAIIEEAERTSRTLAGQLRQILKERYGNANGSRTEPSE